MHKMTNSASCNKIQTTFSLLKSYGKQVSCEGFPYASGVARV